MAAKLVEEAPTLEEFRKRWIVPTERHEVLGRLPDGGRSALLVRVLDEMTDYDLYDTLGELAYGLEAKRCTERAEAFGYKQAVWLEGLPPETRATLKALITQFAREGTDGLENPSVFQTPEVSQAGGVAALWRLGRPVDVLIETKQRLFAA